MKIDTTNFTTYKAFFKKYINLNILEWSLIKSKLQIKKFKKGDLILRFGDICTNLYFINYGVARAYLIDENGKDYTWSLFFNDKNSKVHNIFVTDYESFLHQSPSMIEIEVLQDCELIYNTYDDIQFLYNHLKNGERFGRLMAEEAYSYMHSCIIDRQTKPASQRFQEFMIKTPYLLEIVPQYHIATFLGITPQHLSRLKKEYKINKCE